MTARTVPPQGVPARADGARFRDLGKTARVDDWWKPKAVVLLGVVYAATLVAGLPFPALVALLPPALATILGIGAFGHLVNDWCDLDADGRAGKANRLAGRSAPERLALLAFALGIALIPWLVLPRDSGSLVLLAIELALLVAYAAPPFRLKARPAAAVAADAAYAYAVPAVLAAHTFFLAAAQPTPGWVVVPLFGCQLALGARHYLNHVALDRAHDIVSGTRTWATTYGVRRIHLGIRHVVLPIELGALAAYLVAVGNGRVWLPLVLAALFFATAAFQIVLSLGRRYTWLPYRFSRSHLDRFHQDIVPLSMLAALTWLDSRFSLVAVAHLVLFSRAVRVRLRGVAARALPVLLAPIGWPARALAQALARSQRGIPDDSGHTTAPCPARADASARPTIAVVNINKDKYTETFISELVPRLPYRVLYLHGGELPAYDAEDREFLSSQPSLKWFAASAETLGNLEPGHFRRHSIASYLQSRNVRLVLAHFGPVGAAMLPITRDVGLPLIVCFHGYDVFHRETLARHEDAYRRLFDEAAAIVAVSERMVARLAALGARRDRLVHLPAFVNLDLFPPVDRSGLPPHVLAVGRFAETKSPHLTILAFERVAAVMPEARLTMVGKGGGGELFEACLILIKALGLEDRVTLKGVLSHHDVALEMRAARVFVQHSVTTPESGDMEGKPVAVMEAMASGLPVVATRHSGIDELIVDGDTGLLVDEYDVDGMAGAMLRLLRDDELVRRLGTAASASIRGNPLIADHVTRLAALIDRAIAGA